jgi:LemA protein
VRIALAAIVVTALLVFAGARYTGARKRLVAQRQAIDTQWAEVDSAMQRRADLITGLVEPSTGHAVERATVAQIIDARAALTGASTPKDKMAAYDRLNVAISRLLVVVGNNRRLRSGAKLSHLPDDVSNTENEVNIARQKYNEALQTYNTTLQLFPNNIVAAVSGFTRNDAYIHTEASAGEAPKGQF